MQVHTLISSENGPIILWVMYPHRGDELEHTADSIRELVVEEQFTLVAIQIDDWNRISHRGDRMRSMDHLPERRDGHWII